MSKKGSMRKRDIIQLLDYPSESEPEVEVDAPRRTPTDRLVDHPAELSIPRQRGQGPRLGNVQPTTNLTIDPIGNTARETDLQVHPQEINQSPPGDVNISASETDSQVHPRDSYQSPPDDNVNITMDATDLQVHPQDSYQSNPSNINNSASETDSQVHPRDSYQSPPDNNVNG